MFAYFFFCAWGLRNVAKSASSSFWIAYFLMLDAWADSLAKLKFCQKIIFITIDKVFAFAL